MRRQRHPPDLILVPGGVRERECAAVRFGRCGGHARVRAIVISSGVCDLLELQRCSTDGERLPVITDRRANCTVSNFTSMLSDLIASHVRHVLVLTSAEHAPRAFAVAHVVLRAHGIAVSCRALPPLGKRDAVESRGRALRDVLRSLMFALCGADLGSVGAVIRRVHPDRARASHEWTRSQQPGPADGHYVLTIPHRPCPGG